MIIFGASGHGKVVHSIKENETILFFDDNPNLKEFQGLKVIGYSSEKHKHEQVVIAIGDNQIRKKVVEKVKHNFDTAIADSAQLAKTATIGQGSQIIHGAIIQASSKIGEHCVINTGASVDHDCTISDFCHIAPQVTLCGDVTVGEGTIIGAGSTVIPGITIGEWCKIGAGSVVTKNIPNGSIAVGNPARIIKTND